MRPGVAAVLVPAGEDLRYLLRVARHHGLVLRHQTEGDATDSRRGHTGPFWFGQTPEREWTVWVARHSTGWSVRVVCAAGEVRLNHATPRAVWTGLAALLGDDWSWQLGLT